MAAGKRGVVQPLDGRSDEGKRERGISLLTVNAPTAVTARGYSAAHASS
ncbi:MAG: hypothetical protein PHO37_05400 [Kiritimatiellae bacterium]|nr:hypothetical protein [Kiritimatiellia bacterium]